MDIWNLEHVLSSNGVQPGEYHLVMPDLIYVSCLDIAIADLYIQIGMDLKAANVRGNTKIRVTEI